MKQEEIGWLMKLISDQIGKTANAFLTPYNITVAQSRLLVLLDEAENKTLTLKQLETQFDVSQPTMVGIIKRLEEKKYIQSSSSQKDKRVKMVTLTSLGKSLTDKVIQHLNQVEQELNNQFNEEERLLFLRQLNQLYQILREKDVEHVKNISQTN